MSLRFRLRHLREQVAAYRRKKAKIAQISPILRSLRAFKNGARRRRLICIGLIEHFGDIIACEPVARHIRRRFPQDKLVWITKPAYRDLVAFHPALDGVVTVDSLSDYDLVIGSSIADEFVDLHVNLRVCSKHGSVHLKTAGDPAITPENYYNFGSLLEAFCRSAGLPPLQEAPLVYLPPESRERVDAIAPAGPFIVVHASSNEAARDWEQAKWIELMAAVRTPDAPVFVEVGLLSQFAHLVPGTVNLCGKLSLGDLGELIRRSCGFIGIDSGPAHFANAFERPSVILLGRYRAFARYQPYTGFFRQYADDMLEHANGPASEISVAAVAARARRIWNAPGARK